MENPEGKEQDRLAPHTEQPKSGVRNIIIIVGIIIVVAVVGLYLAGYLTPPSSSTQTWQQYGMSMQYPSGLQAQYSGVFEQQATSDSGSVYWVWNQAKTQLALTWISVSAFDYEAGFNAIYQALLSVASNVTLTGQGTITMAGSTWQYQTYQFDQLGRTNYESCALYFNSTTQRGYEIDFIDVNPTTLNSLMVYGNTFTR